MNSMATLKYVARQAPQQQGIIIGDAWATDNAKAPVRIQFRAGWDKEANKVLPLTHEIEGGTYASVVMRSKPRLDKNGKPLPKAPNAVVILDATAS